MTISIEKRGQRFWADISLHDASGAYHRERKFVPGATKAEAMDSARARERYLYQHGDTPPKPASPSLTDFSERWMKEYVIANGQKPSSVAAREVVLRRHLVPVLGKLPLDAVGEPEIQRVKLHCAEENLSPKTTDLVLMVLSGMLHTAHRWGVIATLPKIQRPRVPQAEVEFYDFPQWEMLVESARRIGPMAYAAILLGGEAGLRRGELIALRQSDVGRVSLRVVRNDWRGIEGSTKGGRGRTVPLTSRLQEAIAAIRHLRGPRLLYHGDTPVTANHLNRWMERVTRRAGLPVCQHVHMLRHTFASHLAMRGVHPKVIRELMGHASIRETDRYMHLAKGSAEAAIALLEAPAAAGAKEKRNG